jgi:hypothetical protein
MANQAEQTLRNISDTALWVAVYRFPINDYEQVEKTFSRQR